MKCEHCGQEITAPATEVSIYGMYDGHIFHKVEGGTVDEIINNWLSHIADPVPAMVGGRKIDDLGPSALCPAIVMNGKQEIRRVGKMVHPDHRTRSPRTDQDLNDYRQALLNDPDIPRLLAGA